MTNTTGDDNRVTDILPSTIKATIFPFSFCR
jgi:hypothetical protein